MPGQLEPGPMTDSEEQLKQMDDALDLLAEDTSDTLFLLLAMM